MAGTEKGYVDSKLVSADSDKGTTSIVVEEEGSSFTVDYGSLLQNVKRISVLTVQFPNNFYNIIADRNGNLFQYIYNGTPHSFTISEGFYTVGRLMEVLETNIAAQNGGLKPFMDLQTDTGKVFINNGTMLTNLTITLTTIWDQLGFITDTVITTTDNYVATNLPSLQGLTKVYLMSTALAIQNGMDVGGEQKSNLLAVPIKAQFGEMVLFECKQDVLCEITYPIKRNLQIIDFQLVDRNGEIVYLNGGNLKVELRVWFDKY